ncbi:nucleoside deaminase [Bifidobacterium saguini]|nr:nucleoside deaminase [Bifidobacterium saguini]QTB90006.1 nucleoside deaminase [Bifidobacterium saguini]
MALRVAYEEAMRQTIELAKQAAAAGDVPVGAVVLDASGAIIGRGYNTRETHGDPLAHAEILAMREAAQFRARQSSNADAATAEPATAAVRAWNLADCTLVVTLEPCPMCAGACVQTHIGTIVFGAWDAKLGACGSVWDIPRDPHIGHTPEVHGGILERDCQAILTDFFAARR